MAVEIVVHKVDRFTIGTPGGMHTHPVYRKLADTLTGWGTLPNADMANQINQVLSTYNGRLTKFRFTEIVFEFDTQEDLTQFVLAWS